MHRVCSYREESSPPEITANIWRRPPEKGEYYLAAALLVPYVASILPSELRESSASFVIAGSGPEEKIETDLKCNFRIVTELEKLMRQVKGFIFPGAGRFWYHCH